MNLYDVLERLNIKYEQIEHEAVYTMEDIQNLNMNIEGESCKNLFLKNKKGEFYLMVLPEDKRADIKAMAKENGIANLSFANEDYLKDILNLERGACTPLGIINDKENKVVLLIDKELKGKRLTVHPNRNTATMSIEYDDLIKFINHIGNKYILV